MKKNKTKKGKAYNLFREQGIKKIINNPKRKASIDEKFEMLRISEEIEKLRKKSKVTQNYLAKKTNIAQEELSRIERGKRNITLSTYFRILKGLGYEAEIKYHKIHHD